MGGQLWWAMCLSGNPPNFVFLLCAYSSVVAINFLGCYMVNKLSLSLLCAVRVSKPGVFRTSRYVGTYTLYRIWNFHSLMFWGGFGFSVTFGRRFNVKVENLWDYFSSFKRVLFRRRLKLCEIRGIRVKFHCLDTWITKLEVCKSSVGRWVEISVGVVI